MESCSIDFQGKTILLLCPNFYDYKELIMKELEKLGAKVIYVENKMFPEDWRCCTFLPISLVKYCKNPKYKTNYIRDILKLVEGVNIDHLFAINGFCVTKNLISKLKKQNPQIKTSLFLWDSLCYWKYSHIIALFDYKFSFDHNDCCRYANLGLKYLPDFFIGDKTDTKYYYDVVHIGSVSVFSADRIKILNEIQNECDAKGLKSYIRVVTKLPVDMRENIFRHFLYFFFSCKHRKLYYYLYKYRDSKILTNDHLGIEEVHKIESSSRVVIDIPPSKQMGLTIRSLEALNRGQKLITTNNGIQLDSFYNSNNVFIINSNSTPKIDKSFINKPVEKINIDYLHISKWVKIILCGSV